MKALSQIKSRRQEAYEGVALSEALQSRDVGGGGGAPSRPFGGETLTVTFSFFSVSVVAMHAAEVQLADRPSSPLHEPRLASHEPSPPMCYQTTSSLQDLQIALPDKFASFEPNSSRLARGAKDCTSA